MDEADTAQDLIDHQITNSLGNLQAEQEAKALLPSAHECVECGSPIPKARREIVPGCQLCIICAERLESINKGIRHD